MQKRYKEDFDKKVRLYIEVQPEHERYVDRPPRRVQRPKKKATDPLRGYSDNLGETVTEEGRKLFS